MESDAYFAKLVAGGAFGKFLHLREPARIEKQTIIRLNRDTLYSSAVFDLDAGPVTITLPDVGKRYVSTQIIDEDHYTHNIFYGGGTHTVTKEQIGTHYVLLGVRAFFDPADLQDLKAVHQLQDAIVVAQPGGPGAFAVPNWDAAS